MKGSKDILPEGMIGEPSFKRRPQKHRTSMTEGWCAPHKVDRFHGLTDDRTWKKRREVRKAYAVAAELLYSHQGSMADPPDMQESTRIYRKYLIRNFYERKSTTLRRAFPWMHYLNRSGFPSIWKGCVSSSERESHFPQSVKDSHQDINSACKATLGE
jgi:hypothetical protein